MSIDTNPGAFKNRHIGPTQKERNHMLEFLGYKTLDDLTNTAVPASIRMRGELAVDAARTEQEALGHLKSVAKQNTIAKSFIGMGYNGTFVPGVIQRNILENPGWYTQYTPYQAEIAQGRLEALLNFQTMISDLTGLEISNSSLLDEATAAAEAMALSFASRANESASVFFISDQCHPQTISLVKTRAWPLGIEVVVGSHKNFKADAKIFGILLQYPATDGGLENYAALIQSAKAQGTFVTLACDILSLCVLKSPGELGADIAVGSAQRFGVPMGFGGPHAAFFAVKDEFKRKIPGRIVGVSLDKEGRKGIRLALQTREQHIRREKATSNICTSQVLLAVMASMYAVYHGPEGLKFIANSVHQKASGLAKALQKAGLKLKHQTFFDTLCVLNPGVSRDEAQKRGINFRYFTDGSIGISVDETTSKDDLNEIATLLTKTRSEVEFDAAANFSNEFKRSAKLLPHAVFNSYHSETEMLRYIRRLEAKDLSLTSSMIPLGSCTMKLNATSELFPVTWAEFGQMHPFAPSEQTAGYKKLFADLEKDLCAITGFDAVSLQPNSGAQGEYAGLLAIMKYFESKGQTKRNICLIPASAHGTNPASAVMAGMKVVVVACDQNGNVDVADLKKKASEHAQDLSCLMITYPSTHGVFEESITEICEAIHKNGGQVYMDGANMNAQVGLCQPGKFGPDVCHLNLHKTFCIPHGGGGPGVGPICVKEHLAPYLPGHSVVAMGGEKTFGNVSAAPWGSASILPISWMYIKMMGPQGLKEATQVAILNANYMAKKIDAYFPVVYKGNKGLVAHECIVDLRDLKAKCGIDVEDVAKRLMDYGFHAPTVSFPIASTLMIEPTESESLAELDRFCDAMIAIRKEISKVESGAWPKDNNPLKNAPHTASSVIASEWNRPYSREEAVYPAKGLKDHKFWPPVARIDGAYGDRNLVCTCDPIESYQ